MESSDLARLAPELLDIVRSGSISYPISDKSDFVAQMVSGSRAVVFRGVSYDMAFGAALMPEFFFPIISEEDLLAKAAELLISRGLLPIP
jgi:hypothetical protein